MTASVLQLASSTVRPNQIKHTDWYKCVLCQIITTLKVLQSTLGDKDVGYKTLSEILWRFHELKKLLMPNEIQRLDDGLAPSQIAHQVQHDKKS